MTWQYRPARDLGLPPSQRLRSLGRERGLIGLGLHWAALRLVRGYLRFAHGLTIQGQENLPDEPPFVLVGNHSSHLDALTLCAALRGVSALRAYPLAAGEVFFGAPAASAFAAFFVNALPVWRGHTRPGDLDAMRQRLQEDRLAYVLFPEGTRSRDGTMARFRSGVGALVAGTEVPVVPCYLDGAFAAWPASSKVPRPGRKLHLRIGAPLRFPELTNERTDWVKVAGACENAVRALGGRGSST